MIERRKLLIGSLATLFCAPAIVRASSLMPIKPLVVKFKDLEFGEWVYFDDTLSWLNYKERLFAYISNDHKTFQWSVPNDPTSWTAT